MSQPATNESNERNDAATKPVPPPANGGFANDPPDPNNPNEVREESLKKLRP